MENVESIIIENLISNEEYIRIVLPHLKSEYFDNNVEKTLFEFIESLFTKYNKQPTKKILQLMAKEHSKFNQDEFDEAKNLIENLSETPEDTTWLTERTEQFCKDRAVYLALVKAIALADGQDKTMNREAIPTLLQEALSVCFDKNVGHDYLEDFEHRWDFYHLKEKKVPFPLEIFNKITNGGVSSKTLNVLLMMTNAGKSLFMCDHAAFCVKNGIKALYITLEMAQEKIAERIDCNLLDLTMPELKRVNKKDFLSKGKELQDMYKGNLVIKEYPTSGAHVGHFQSLMDELRLKKNFVPEIVFIDYINICASQKLKMGGSINSYQYIKSVSEELRAFAVFNDVPVISATQTNKSSWNNSDIDMSDTSESGGLPMTVDFLIAGMRTEELDELGQLMWKVLKSRYNSTGYYHRFVTGLDLPHFRFYDISEEAQGQICDRGITDTTVVKSMPNSKFVGNTISSKVDLIFE
jgi:replicative DNA helicase